MKKSFKFDTFEITRRELIVCVAIISLFFVIGFGISGILENHAMEKNEKYYTATKIDNSPEQFQYGMKTSIGNAMVYGTVSTVNPITIGELKGEYLAINKITERYTRHTRQVAYRVGKVTHYRTEVYYTWDNASSDCKTADKVKFVDTVCNTNKFGFNNWTGIRLSKDTVTDEYQKQISDNCIYPSKDFWANEGDIRYSYQGVPKEFVGTALVDLRDNDFTLSHAFYYNETPTEIVEGIDKSQAITKRVGWGIWIVVAGITCFVFVYARNKWLED